MTCYYMARKGSEAYKRLDAYFAEREAEQSALRKLLRRLKVSDDVRIRGERIVALCPQENKPPADVPGGWQVKRLFPKRNKANAALIREIQSYRIPSPEGITKALFACSTPPLRIEGLSARTSVGYGRYQGRMVIDTGSEQYATMLWKEADWPNGLRPVRASTVERWKEMDQAEGKAGQE